MAVVFQRPGSPYWYAWLKDPRSPDGMVKASTKQKSKSAALRAVPRMQVALDEQLEAELEANLEACGMTWLDGVAFLLDPSTGDPDLKGRTADGYAKIAVVVTKVLGDFDLGQLTHEKLEHFCHERRKMAVQPHKARDTGRKVTDQTIRNNLTVISSVYKWAMERNHPQRPKTNPLKTFDRAFLRKSKKVDRHLRPMQFDEALTACKTLLHRTMLITLCGSGLRSGELMELRWPEVDFKTNVIEFGNCDPDRSKNSRARRIPLLTPVADALQVWLAAQIASGEWERDGLVFPGWAKNEKGEWVQRRRYDLKYLIKIVRSRTGVKGYFNHGLRHTFASWCRQKGVDADAIRRALGHATTSTTDGYAHHIDDSMLGMFRSLEFPITAQSTAQTNGLVGGTDQKEDETISENN
jgi:integrase